MRSLVACQHHEMCRQLIFSIFSKQRLFSKQSAHDLLRWPHDEKRTLGADERSSSRGPPRRREGRGVVVAARDKVRHRRDITQAILKAPQIYTSAERASTLRSSLSYFVALPPLITLIVGNDSVLNFDDTKSRSSSPLYFATVMPLAAASAANFS